MNKKIIIEIIAVIAILTIVVGTIILNNSNENNEANNNLANTDKKILIAYFSYSGNTEVAAKEIQDQIGGDLFEIKRKEEYSSSNLSDEAKEEIESKKRPELAEKLENIDRYDVVFVGYPIWWHSTPVVINTFLESYDLSGKTVIPFCTSGGSDIEETLESFKSSCNSNKILEGITISGSSGNSNSGKEKLKNWITSLDL